MMVPPREIIARVRAASYLRIPGDYSRWLGGLGWSDDGEAVGVLRDHLGESTTYVVAEMIAPFLEGFGSGEVLPCFGYVLHFLWLIGAAGGLPKPARGQPERLVRAFHRAGKPLPLRNAGALCAYLGRDLPRPAVAPDLAEVLTTLTMRRWQLGKTMSNGQAIAPPLPPSVFESRVLAEVVALSDAELDHWMRHGRGPIGPAGEEVARVVPPNLLATLAALESRPRLAASAALVPSLAGALALPPRRLTPAALPTGGYSDIATRGLPEQILPTQFALDGLEFLRRFAERELLYFHREEPNAPTTEELVLLVDQGVLTWGDVRLVLAAAALALGKQAVRRRLPLFVAATSNEGQVVAAGAIEREALGELLEASDLSAHPAAALHRTLEAPSEHARDVVLLTHPRSLDHPEVAEAARTVRPGVRLFAVSVNASGAVALSEMRGGAPVVLSRCRVEVRPAEAPTAPPPPRSATRAPNAWTGDVEPVPFPFPFGAFQGFRDDLFAFDHEGERVLLIDVRGLLHSWKVDGSAGEMPPRPMIDGKPLTAAEAVVGVAGGFVVCGHCHSERVAAHLDFERRVCTIHRLGRLGDGRDLWSYHPAQHSVVLRGAQMQAVCGIDLSADPSEARFWPLATARRGSERARQAVESFTPRLSNRLYIIKEDLIEAMPATFDQAIGSDPTTGSVTLYLRHSHDTIDALPRSDGRPVLFGAELVAARSCGDLIATITENLKTRVRALYMMDIRSSGLLGEFVLHPSVGDFAITDDGRRVAFRQGGSLAIHEDASRTVPAFVTPRAKGHQRLKVRLDGHELAIDTGKYHHRIKWNLGAFDHVKQRRSSFQGILNLPVIGTVRQFTELTQLPLDHDRFVHGCTHGGMSVVVDVVGHVVVFDGSGQVVCIFHAFRDELAGWLPDGTRFGPVSTLGGPPTPDAESCVAKALLAASQRGKERAS